MTTGWAGRIGLIALCLGVPAAGLQAQGDRLERAAAQITEAGVRHTVMTIADDSMLGRDTPSRGLELTAAYVERAFRDAGLKPGAAGRFRQQYPLVRRSLDPSHSSIVLMRGSERRVILSLATDAAYAQGTIPLKPVTASLVVLGGRIDPSRIQADSLEGKIVLWLADFSESGLAKVDAIGTALATSHAAAIIIVPSDTAVVAGPAAAQSRERVELVRPEGLSFTAFMAKEAAIARQDSALGAEVQAIRRATETVIRGLPITARLELRDRTVGRTSAPNVIGIVHGSDPALAREFVVVSAHMDHLGVAAGQAGDSIFNGADDNASGTAGLVELARAFGRIRPRRSIAIVAVSGEEKGLWGSGYFTAHPTIPLDRIVADINMDMIGRNWRDTVGVIGREYSNLGQILDQVAARHPELSVTPVDDRWPAERRFYRSDHYNFATHGVPILFLSSGYSPDYHLPSDSPDKIDAEKEARLVKLIFYFGAELADRAARPVWDAESRKRIVRP